MILASQRCWAYFSGPNVRASRRKRRKGVNKETVMIIGLLLLAGFAAYVGKWEFVSVVSTGLFALLNITPSPKGQSSPN